MIDRKRFFDVVKAKFGKLSQGQVEGFNAILDAWEQSPKLTDVRWLAYMLVTAWHETATRMQPVIETRGPNEKTNPSVDTAIARLDRAWHDGKLHWVKERYWAKDEDGLSWLGRGLPQITHKAMYAKAEKALGVPFTKDPDLALLPENATNVMFWGMTKGAFTGRKLGDYFNATTDAPVLARYIVNGQDRAKLIAGYYKSMLSALT